MVLSMGRLAPVVGLGAIAVGLFLAQWSFLQACALGGLAFVSSAFARLNETELYSFILSKSMLGILLLVLWPNL